MQSTTITIGQEVWITGGLDKDKKGTVVGGGFGVYQVELDSETKTFDRTNVTTTNPKSHSVPLPPNFLPTEFKVGDVVEIHGYGATTYNGIKGKIIRLPTSTSYRNGGDKRYGIAATNGNKYFFEAEYLRKVAKKARIVGEEISHEAVRIGDTIRTDLRTTDGTYSQLSSKEGRVTRIVSSGSMAGKEPCQVFSFSTERNHGLTFGIPAEKITLLEAAVDPYIAIVDNLAAGTVVINEKSTGEVLSYVKSLPFCGTPQWHVVSSVSKRSSSFVGDADVIEALNNGAEIVHKVRKPVTQIVPPPPAF